jgi:hypothetical protein
MVAALVAGIAFAAPSAALADCGGGPSAQHVYSECVPGGSGGKPTKPTTKGPGPTISHQAANAIKKAGKDRRVLSAFARSSGRKFLDEPVAGSVSEPSGWSSALDLGSGPIALLAILAGAALALLTATGVRRWRHSS